MKTQIALLTFILSFSLLAANENLAPQYDFSKESQWANRTDLKREELLQVRPWMENTKAFLEELTHDADITNDEQRYALLVRGVKTNILEKFPKGNELFIRVILHRALSLDKMLAREGVESFAFRSNFILASIKLALNYYESDMAFLERGEQLISYSQFAKDYALFLSKFTKLILDASALYQWERHLLGHYHVDLYRDNKNKQNAYMKQIGRISRLLNTMPKTSPSFDPQALAYSFKMRHLRRQLGLEVASPLDFRLKKLVLNEENQQEDVAPSAVFTNKRKRRNRSLFDIEFSYRNQDRVRKEWNVPIHSGHMKISGMGPFGYLTDDCYKDNTNDAAFHFCPRGLDFEVEINISKMKDGEEEFNFGRAQVMAAGVNFITANMDLLIQGVGFEYSKIDSFDLERLQFALANIHYEHIVLEDDASKLGMIVKVKGKLNVGGTTQLRGVKLPEVSSTNHNFSSDYTLYAATEVALGVTYSKSLALEVYGGVKHNQSYDKDIYYYVNMDRYRDNDGLTTKDVIQFLQRSYIGIRLNFDIPLDKKSHYFLRLFAFAQYNHTVLKAIRGTRELNPDYVNGTETSSYYKWLDQKTTDIRQTDTSMEYGAGMAFNINFL